MNELDDIKARAAEYESEAAKGFSWTDVKADLDRAIAIASEMCGYPGCTERYVHVWNIGVGLCEEHHPIVLAPVDALKGDLDEAQAEVERLTNLRSTQASERREQDVKMWAEEAKKARADVLRLRDEINRWSGNNEYVPLMQETESYEEYR